MSRSEIPNDQRQAARITLGLLNAVEEECAVTQRRLASELGIAVGLVNSYLRRCVNKGLIKVQQVPRRRYAYYLTPKGFAEKSRLTASYFLQSFDFFREARSSCDEIFKQAGQLRWRSVVLIGHSDLAEIAYICSLNHASRVVAVVDEKATRTFASLPLYKEMGDLKEVFDGTVITSIEDTQDAFDHTVAKLGASRVLVPSLLARAISTDDKNGAIE